MTARAQMMIRWALVCVVVAAVLALPGCSGEPAITGTAADPVVPAAWDLSTPESAVRSYLDWVSFSYRMANSDIPTATMTPAESVRIDAYIQLNRMDGRGLEQALTGFEVTSVSEEETSAVLTARETWDYRYFALDGLAYLTSPLQASYETTYTLLAGPDGWLVDRVEARSLGEVE